MADDALGEKTKTLDEAKPRTRRPSASIFFPFLPPFTFRAKITGSVGESARFKSRIGLNCSALDFSQWKPPG